VLAALRAAPPLGVDCNKGWTSRRGSADAQPSGDLALADPFLVELADFIGVALDGCGSPMRPPLLACLCDPGPDTVPQNVAFELREHGEHAGQGAPTGRGQVQRFRERDEADPPAH
jgi:hypothetical protein